MAARERPSDADERLVAEALSRAFSEPIDAAAVQAGRDAVLAAADDATQQAAADQLLVDSRLTGSFATPLTQDEISSGVASVRRAAKHERTVGRRLLHSASRHVAAAAVTVIALGSMSGAAAASSSALPGQALYPVKRVVEQVMVTAAITPNQEARMAAKLAQRRLDEAALLLAQGADPDVVEPLLNEYDQHVALAKQLGDLELAMEVATLEATAQDLRAQTATAVAGSESGAPTETPAPANGQESSATTTGERRESTPPAPTTTEPPASSSPGTTTETKPPPASSTTSPPAEESPPATEPTPEPTESVTPTPTPTPSASPEPTRPGQSTGEPEEPPATEKPKTKFATDPTATATPTPASSETPSVES